MEYSINKLAQMSGISTRTLRYYDQIGLLCPERVSSNGYRIYGQNEIDLLQQILFYRELGFKLESIRDILKSTDYDKRASLESHLSGLLQRKKQIELLIKNVTKSISSLKGENIMKNKEKFEGFKKNIIKDNETKYGTEIREKYGNDVIDSSYQKLQGMNKEQWDFAQELSEKINVTLKKAVENGDPSSEIAQTVCDMHRQWLCLYWKDGTYSKQAHISLAHGYLADERFVTYYDSIISGATEFLVKAIEIYCK